jgi:predicted unusual protein kinase regulating ubiquinone biosynthesis (AarF/ABC1/UbiB family)
MPYYSLGNLETYRWNRQNFEGLKNVLKQVIFALLYAHETFGFVHGDMHVGNVILRLSKKKTVSYGKRSLPIMGIYPMIMDFCRFSMREKNPSFIYKDIVRFLDVTRGMEHSDLQLDVNSRRFARHVSENTPITDEIYDEVENIIDGIQILYAHSEIPTRIWT